MPLVNPRAHSCWSQEIADSGAYLSCRVFRWGCCCEEAEGVRARLVGQQVLPGRKAGQLPQHCGDQPPDHDRLQPGRSSAVQQLLGCEALVPEELAAVHAHMPHLHNTPQTLGSCSLRSSVQACIITSYELIGAERSASWNQPSKQWPHEGVLKKVCSLSKINNMRGGERTSTCAPGRRCAADHHLTSSSAVTSSASPALFPWYSILACTTAAALQGPDAVTCSAACAGARVMMRCSPRRHRQYLQKTAQLVSNPVAMLGDSDLHTGSCAVEAERGGLSCCMRLSC